MQDPPKFTQIWNFGLKVRHLATLPETCFSRLSWREKIAVTANLAAPNYPFAFFRRHGSKVARLGIFSNQKSQFGKIFEGLGIEKVGIFFGHF
jgi:hypothetical protein